MNTAIWAYEATLNRLFAEADPVGLAKYGDEEYEGVVGRFMSKISRSSSVTSIRKALSKSFATEYYGLCEADEKALDELAQHVYEALREAPID